MKQNHNSDNRKGRQPVLVFFSIDWDRDRSKSGANWNHYSHYTHNGQFVLKLSFHTTMQFTHSSHTVPL